MTPDTFGAEPSHTRDGFAATVQSGGLGPKAPGEMVHARGGYFSAARIVTPPSSSPTRSNPWRSYRPTAGLPSSTLRLIAA